MKGRSAVLGARLKVASGGGRIAGPYDPRVVASAKKQVDMAIKDIVDVAKKLGEAEVKVNIDTAGKEKPEGFVYDEAKPDQKYNYSREYYLMNHDYVDEVDFAVSMRECGDRYNNYKSDSTVDNFEDKEEKKKLKNLLKEAMGYLAKQMEVMGMPHAEMVKHDEIPKKCSTMDDKGKAKVRPCSATRIRVGPHERTVDEPTFELAREKAATAVKVEKGEKKGGRGVEKEEKAVKKQRKTEVSFYLVCGACKEKEPEDGGSYKYCVVCKVGIHGFIGEDGKGYVQAWPEAV